MQFGTAGPKQNPIKSAGKMGSGATKLLKGAAAMLIMAAAVLVFAVAMQQLAKVDWDAIWPGAVIALIALAGAMLLLSAGPVAAAMMAGSLVFEAMSVALLLFGIALNVVAMALPFRVWRNGSRSSFNGIGSSTNNSYATYSISTRWLGQIGGYEPNGWWRRWQR